MLRGRDRAAEPGDVADVDQQRRLRQLADDFLAERIFVADVDRHFLAGDRERPLVLRAARKILQRYRQHGDDPSQHGAQRDELAERHEVRFAVSLGGRGAERNDAVVVLAARQAFRHADQDVAAVSAGMKGKFVQVLARHLPQEQRQRGFRQDDELARGKPGKRPVGFERGQHAVLAPLQVLRHVALQQAHLDRPADRLGPFDLLQDETDEPQAGERQGEGAQDDPISPVSFSRVFRDAEPGADQQSRARRRRECDAVYAQHRRVAGERARRDLGVTDGEPGEAGEYPAARPFRQHPGRRRQQAVTDGGLHPGSGAGVAHGRGEEREECAEEDGCRPGQRHRHGAEIVQAYVNPRDAEQEQAEPEGKAGRRGGARAGRARPEVEQAREGDDRLRKKVVGRVSRYGHRAQDERDDEGRGLRNGKGWPPGFPGRFLIPHPSSLIPISSS